MRIILQGEVRVRETDLGLSSTVNNSQSQSSQTGLQPHMEVKKLNIEVVKTLVTSKG